MNTGLALKIEKALGMEEGTFMILQVYYDIKIEREKQQASMHPDFSIIRKILFWDTDMANIDWNSHYKYVIKRIFERGNNKEKQEMMRFYGKEKIKEITGSTKVSGNDISIMPHLKTR